MTSPRHFLDLDRIEPGILRRILDESVEYKRCGNSSERPLQGRILAMLFERPSTRTRVSFDVAMRQLGGQTLLLSDRESQLGRGETVADTARVLSRYVDAIMLRTDSADKLEELAGHATVPVINGLTDRTHPCQLMADVMTFEEHRGPIRGRSIAWIGDGNNVASSWIQAAVQFDFCLRLACPPEFAPDQQVLGWARGHGGDVTVTDDPKSAASGADCIVTDVWVSMGDDGEADGRRRLLRPYQVNGALLRMAKPDAVFMHCLPAHRGEEVTEEVIDGPQSVVWDEAENRLYAQKSILTWCLS